MMRRRTGQTNDMTAALADLRRMPHKRRPATRAGTPKKEGHSAIPQAVAEPPLRASSDSSERD
jgi:hypothetical protein